MTTTKRDTASRVQTRWMVCAIGFTGMVFYSWALLSQNAIVPNLQRMALLVGLIGLITIALAVTLTIGRRTYSWNKGVERRRWVTITSVAFAIAVTVAIVVNTFQFVVGDGLAGDFRSSFVTVPLLAPLHQGNLLLMVDQGGLAYGLCLLLVTVGVVWNGVPNSATWLWATMTAKVEPHRGHRDELASRRAQSQRQSEPTSRAQAFAMSSGSGSSPFGTMDDIISSQYQQ